MAARPSWIWPRSASASAWAWPPAFAVSARDRAVGSTTEALARNPGTRAGLLMFMIIGLAFIESLTLFTFAMIIIKVK